MVESDGGQAPNGGHDRPVLEVLLQAARPDIYRLNAFRVAELPVDATARDLSRRQQMVEMASQAGLPVPPGPGRALPLEGNSNPTVLAEAIQRLRDPETRLVDEFFWFWPHFLGHSQDDPALAALARGDTQAAGDLWLGQERNLSEANVSMHNLAILAHATALDLETTGVARALTTQEQAQVDAAWSRAFQRWHLLLDYEGFWNRLMARIRDLDDPRLPTDTAGRLQATLPLALLLINAQLAMSAAERGGSTAAARHLEHMEQSGFDRSIVDEALRRTVEPLRTRLKNLCKSLEAEADVDPAHAAEPTRRLIEQSQPTLATLDVLLPAGHATRDGIHDEVALTALRCQITYGNKTDDWRTSLDLLQATLPLAAGQAARSRIEENIAIVKRNLEASLCWYCGQATPVDACAWEVKMHGDITHEPTVVGGTVRTRVRWRQGSIKVPRCPACRSAHDKLQTGQIIAAIAGGLLGLVLGAATSQFACAVVLAVAGAGCGAGIAEWCAKRLTGVKSRDDVEEYPPIANLKKQGWKIGEKPSGVS